MADSRVSQNETSAEGPLSFYDHHRQPYGHLAIRDHAEAEFMIGDYGPIGTDEGVGKGGEFAVMLVRFGRKPKDLHPHLQVFGDATGSLLAAISAGLLGLLEPVADRDEFSHRLIGIGIADRSHNPMGSPPPVCPSCGRPLDA